MRIAIMGSGGDAPGMNAAIKRFVDYCFDRECEPYFVYDGLEGLIDGSIRAATREDVAGILHLGGAIVRSSRSRRFYDPRFRSRAFLELRRHGIDALVVLGGDGSFRAMELFSKEHPVRFVGIPTTIDNDIPGSDTALGVDTALNSIREALDRIRDTAATLNRAFVIEVMGRECGYLAAASAVTNGAEICLIPEVDFDWNVAAIRLKKEISRGRRYILAIVAEGTGRTDELAEWLKEELGMETRITVLGHVQRGGNPTVRDRLFAFEAAVMAVDHLLGTDEANGVVLSDSGTLRLEKFSKIAQGEYRLDPRLLSMLNRLD